MKLEHSFTVPAPIDRTWEAFNDLERVVPCFPGATLTSFDGDGFEGSCKVKLGPISLVYNGTGRFVFRDPYTLVIEAKGKERSGTAKALVTANLTAAGQSTDVTVGTDLTITGKPAQFGRGVIQDVSDKLLRQFVDCLQSNFGAPVTPQPELNLGAILVSRIKTFFRRLLRRTD